MFISAGKSSCEWKGYTLILVSTIKSVNNAFYLCVKQDELQRKAAEFGTVWECYRPIERYQSPVFNLCFPGKACRCLGLSLLIPSFLLEILKMQRGSPPPHL